MKIPFGCPLWHFSSGGAIVFSAGWKDPSLLIREGYFAMGPDPAGPALLRGTTFKQKYYEL